MLRIRTGEHNHVARCDDGCGHLGSTRDDAITHARDTGHVTYYRYVVEDVFRPEDGRMAHG